MNITKLNKKLKEQQEKISGTDLASVKKDGHDIILFDNENNQIGMLDCDGDLSLLNNNDISAKSLEYIVKLGNTPLNERLEDGKFYNVVLFKDNSSSESSNWLTALRKNEDNEVESCDCVRSSELSCDDDYKFSEDEIDELINTTPEYADVIKAGTRKVE